MEGRPVIESNDAFIRHLIHDASENRSNPLLKRLPEDPLIKELIENYPYYSTLVSGYNITKGKLGGIVVKRLEGDDRTPVEIADDLGLEKGVLTGDGVIMIIKDYIKSSKDGGIDVRELDDKTIVRDLIDLTYGHFGHITLLKMFYEVLEEES